MSESQSELVTQLRNEITRLRRQLQETADYRMSDRLRQQLKDSEAARFRLIDELHGLYKEVQGQEDHRQGTWQTKTRLGRCRMNEEHDKAWKDLAKRAHRGESHVISGGAADRLLRSLPDECMAEADVDAIVESIVSGRSLRAIRAPEVSPTEHQGGVDAPKHVDEDVLQLNRNKGVEDKVLTAYENPPKSKEIG